ncbi:MAG: endolytic transglycosylase MltG [Candidatus Paceibacterota bacterium]|jgi:UPF0755 protein
MPKELKNITENVMDQIHQGKVKMKPRAYFVVGSILTFVGLIFSVIVSTFFVGLIRFSLRTHGPMGQYRFDQIMSSFPWWAVILAILGLFIGIWLIRQYDFSYKKNPWIIIIGFILAIIVAGCITDMAGLNDTMFRYGPMRGMMGNYFQGGQTAPIVTNQNSSPLTTSTAQTVATNVPIKIPPEPTLPPLPEGTDQFVVSLTATSDDISANLLSGGYIKDSTAFSLSIGTTKSIDPGAYKISKVMTPAQILQTLRGKPYMKWVVIPPGFRKEEIAELLAPALGWTAKQKSEWITKDTTVKPEYIEGVYAPNTYLIPVGETPASVTTRLIAKFNENFAYYLPQFTAKNIKWTSGLTLASLVQREAANVADMPLIAGILWNRLNQSMMLNVDATLQYVRGNTGNGWWAPITVADKKIDSPYNTYMHTGLPPHPIAEPSISAIAAVLHPTATDCLYYLHDKNHATHCAATYEEHQANIQKYLIAPSS